jgi:hypothetical protein
MGATFLIKVVSLKQQPSSVSAHSKFLRVSFRSIHDYDPQVLVVEIVKLPPENAFFWTRL